jgi:hypothetical protein
LYCLGQGLTFVCPVACGTGQSGKTDTRIAAVGKSMSEDENMSPEIDLPDGENDVHEIAGAETDEEKALAVAQARLIGDID